eukprot:3672817-Prymnesium_polylepis.1
MTPGRAWRVYGGGAPQSERMQAATLNLEEQVNNAQQLLNRARELQLDTLRNTSGWVQRAMRNANLRVDAAGRVIA